ncbi:PREDICTED: Transposon [Prunus dulcis]|uniref:PREDICTED: Transposon n=1 Tax=Prunus dulcis TaxID=3755 RepID=A0A5E4GK10_PRUDU|nr:PREDICTED: Transposon [Prunus dulcis]
MRLRTASSDTLVTSTSHPRTEFCPSPSGYQPHTHEHPNQPIWIVTNLKLAEREGLITFVSNNIDCFAWSHADARHQPLDPHLLLRDQPRVPTDSPEASTLLQRPNVVIFKKTPEKWRMCVDFTDLNKACTKDSFPLPRIDQLVDTTTSFALLSFLDAYSGYNQIRINPTDDSVLIREPNAIQWAVYYVHRALTEAETRYPILEKLALTLVVKARRLCSYFQAHPISVLTNQHLQQVLHRLEVSKRLIRWFVELREFHIDYKPQPAAKGFTPAILTAIEQTVISAPTFDEREEPSSMVHLTYTAVVPGSCLPLQTEPK